jgi:hypothetical protein
MFIRPIVKRFVIAALSPVAASVAAAQSLPERRMTPAEINGSVLDSNRLGLLASLASHAKVVFGDPSRVGFYMILLFVPAHVVPEFMVQARGTRTIQGEIVPSPTSSFLTRHCSATAAA